MSSRKKVPVELSVKDLSTINQLREKINQVIAKESNAAKAAQILKIWLDKLKQSP